MHNPEKAIQQIVFQRPVHYISEMQKNGPPKESGRIDALVALLNEGINEGALLLGDKLPDRLVEVASLIAPRVFMFDDLKRQVQGRKDFSSVKEAVKNFGKDFLSAVYEKSAEILELPLNNKHLANALCKLTPQEIVRIFNDPVFYKGEDFIGSRADALLNSRDVRGFYARIQAVYQIDGLKDLSFASVVTLVRSEEKAQQRCQLMAERLKIPETESVAVPFVLLSPDKQEWYEKKLKEYPDLQEAKTAFVKIAGKKESEALFMEAQGLVEAGATYSDALKVLSARDAEKRKGIFKLALLEGLSSSGAMNLSQSSRCVSAPNICIGELRELRKLPLGWSDERLSRIIANGKEYKRKGPTAPLSEREELKQALELVAQNVYCTVDDSKEHRLGIRTLAKLNHDQKLALYAIFFDSRKVAEFNNKLLDVSAAEQVKFQWIRSSKKLNEQTPEMSKKDQYELSAFLDSLDIDTRNHAQQLFHRQLNQYVQKRYPGYVKLAEDVVYKIMLATVDNFRPRDRFPKSESAKAPTIIDAFGGQIRGFYKELIQYRLAEDRRARRAYKLFTEYRTQMRKEDPKVGYKAIWDKLESERPDLQEAISVAREVQMEVANLQSK